MKKELSAGIIPYCLRKNEECYLLLLYPQGHWGFPKGHVERNESPLEAARRELKEETDLEVENIHPDFEERINYCYTWEGEERYKEVIFFAGKVGKDKVNLSHEHDDFGWLAPEKALEKITYEDEKKLFKKWLGRES